jgi:hypothetical protein
MFMMRSQASWKALKASLPNLRNKFELGIGKKIDIPRDD